MCGEYAPRARSRSSLTTGDNFYRPDGVATHGQLHAAPSAACTALGVPWHAAWGNHDVGRPGARRAALGSPRPVLRVHGGPGARCSCSTATTPPTRPSSRSSAAELTAAREPVRIVAFHQPLHTAGHPPAVARVARRLLGAALPRAAASTLVLQGHNHVYERIRAGGAHLHHHRRRRRAASTRACRPAGACERCVPAHHFLLVTATRTRVVVRAVTPRGRDARRGSRPPPAAPARRASARAAGRGPRPATAAAHAVATRTVSWLIAATTSRRCASRQRRRRRRPARGRSPAPARGCRPG